MRDPYEVLGVARSATAKDIKAAYRKLAKKYHPDQNPNDPKAKDHFNAATQAYDIIGDEKNRAAFDRGEIDASGKPRFQGFEGHHAGGGGDPFAAFRNQGGGGGRFDFRSGGDAGDIFSEIFGNAFSGARGGGQRRAPVGEDLHASLDVTIEDLAAASRVNASFPDGRKLVVKLPAYVEDGQTIRLKGQGGQGLGGAGDALVKINIRPHPRYRIDGRDLHVDQYIALEDAILGEKITVETPTGKVAMTVPAWSNSDKVLRLKGRGLPVKTGGHADLYVHLRVTLPERTDAELEAWARKHRG